MKCPYCDRHIDYPTQRQLLAWTLRYYGYAPIKLVPIEDVAKRMGITPGCVLELLHRFRICWPHLAPKKRQIATIRFRFNEERDSEPKIIF